MSVFLLLLLVAAVAVAVLHLTRAFQCVAPPPNLPTGQAVLPPADPEASDVATLAALPSAVSFKLDAAEAGWSQLLITTSGKSHAIGDISYITDYWADLVRAGLAMASGAKRAEVVFEHEPQVTYLVFMQTLVGGSTYTCSIASTTFVDADARAEGVRGKLNFVEQFDDTAAVAEGALEMAASSQPERMKEKAAQALAIVLGSQRSSSSG